MIRFGQMTEDEVFVTAAAAEQGVIIENLSNGSAGYAETLWPGKSRCAAAGKRLKAQTCLRQTNLILVSFCWSVREGFRKPAVSPTSPMQTAKPKGFLRYACVPRRGLEFWVVPDRGMDIFEASF